MATIELLTSPLECTPYAPARILPRRVVGVCAHTYTVVGELILVSAVRSRAGQIELRIALGGREAHVVVDKIIPVEVIDGMITELGGDHTPGLAHELRVELNVELRKARYLEMRKAERLARDLAALPGRAKLRAKFKLLATN